MVIEPHSCEANSTISIDSCLSETEVSSNSIPQSQGQV